MVSRPFYLQPTQGGFASHTTRKAEFSPPPTPSVVLTSGPVIPLSSAHWPPLSYTAHSGLLLHIDTISLHSELEGCVRPWSIVTVAPCKSPFIASILRGRDTFPPLPVAALRVCL